MASSAKLFSVVLLALVSLCASSSWTQDSQIPDESQDIPELPPEKAEDTNAVTKTDSADAPNAVVNYDDSAMRGGNFANNIFSEGRPKISICLSSMVISERVFLIFVTDICVPIFLHWGAARRTCRQAYRCLIKNPPVLATTKRIKQSKTPDKIISRAICDFA